ncbi:MAG: glycosyltransferase family 4 protein [Candidatus Micrarchaeota archaeon]
MRQVKILMANPFFFPYMGGTEKVIYEVGKRISDCHEITILTARLDNTREEEEIGGMHVIRLPSRIFDTAPHPIPPPVPVLHGTDRWIKAYAKDFDIVHIHNRFVFSPAFGAAVKKAGKKLCLTIHNARPNGIDLATDIFGSMFDELIAKRLMNKCDAIAGVSESALRATIPSGYKGIATTIHNGIDHHLFKPSSSQVWKERLGIKGKMVLTNARLVEQKGLKHLIRSMENVDADLVVFGRGPLRSDLQKRARSSRVRAHFVSERISEDDLVSLYNSADCFALPSLYEPCSVALLEAMSSGLPCVVSDAGGTPELVQDGKSGIIVPAGDHKPLHAAIHGVLEDPKLARSLGYRARERILSDFTWDHAAGRYLDLYSMLA